MLSWMRIADFSGLFINGKDSPAQQAFSQLSAEQLLAIVTATLPDILATEKLLATANIDQRLLTELSRQQYSKVHLVRVIAASDLRQIARSLGWPVVADLPQQQQPYQLSHGDLLGKNIINTADGYRLIDWEALGLYRRGTAVNHLLSWNLLRLPEEYAESFLQQHIDLCCQLMSVDQRQARLAIYWQMIGEALYWSDDDQQARDWRQRAELILS